jgi:hypothetical protein
MLNAMRKEIPDEPEELIRVLQHAYEMAWKLGADYGFRSTDEEIGRRVRSRFMPLFLARWYTRVRVPKDFPHKAPLIKYMKTQRASLPESARQYLG